ncbi:MAG TPA: hypothetical protein VG013_33785, partial [Gemmataceae bacterium]|nr:hypothetical protein [Gemmataceae bacterium]
IDHLASEDLDQLAQWCSILRSQPRTTIGEKVFSYQFVRAQDDQSATAWELIFYESIAWFCLTASKTRLPT